MDSGDWLDLVPAAEPLALTDRVELAKAHCALVFEDRGGKLTDADVVAVSRRWADAGEGRDDTSDGCDEADADLVAAHLFAWLG
jgi:hypothetical protein